MQKFEMPAISVEEFEIVDVIMTASLVDECYTDSDCADFDDLPLDFG